MIKRDFCSEFFSFLENGFIGGENYENQRFEFCFGECDHRRNSVDSLLAACLDDAGRDDEYDRQYGSYGYEQVRLDVLADGRYLGACRLESVRGNFRRAFGGNLQLFKQKYKRLKYFWRR